MRADRALAALHGAELNFEPQPLEYYTPERGWHADALNQWLPNEPPGDPVPGGAWEIARRLVEDYRMADPAIVRAVWDPSVPLLGRDMLLELRLYRVLSVHAGVRSGAGRYRYLALSFVLGLAGGIWVTSRRRS